MNDHTTAAAPDAVRIASRQVVVALTTVAGLLVTAHLGLLMVTATTGHDVIFGLVGLFDLDSERNVPSFFSGGLLLLNAVLLWLVGRLPEQHYSSRWFVLAAVFVFLSYDEMFSVHEQLTTPLRNTFQTSGLFYYPWVIAYLIPLIALMAWFLPAWLRLSTEARRRLVAAGLLYLFGAVVMEMINGAYDEAYGHGRTLAWGLLASIEESLEMAGLITLVYALFRLLSPAAGGAPVVFDDDYSLPIGEQAKQDR